MSRRHPLLAATLAVTVAGLLGFSAAAPAMAHRDQFSATDTVAVGNPHLTYYGLWTPAHITNQFARCDPDSELNGLDGVWYDIEGFGGHRATLTMDPVSLFKVKWYDESCAFTGPIEDWKLLQDPGELGRTVQSVVPDDARYAIVDLYYGANATFRLTIDSEHDRRMR